MNRSQNQNWGRKWRDNKIWPIKREISRNSSATPRLLPGVARSKRSSIRPRICCQASKLLSSITFPPSSLRRTFNQFPSSSVSAPNSESIFKTTRTYSDLRPSVHISGPISETRSFTGTSSCRGYSISKSGSTSTGSTSLRKPLTTECSGASIEEKTLDLSQRDFSIS